MKVSFDAEALGSLISAIRDNPEMGKTVWKAETHWDTGFQSGAYGCCLITGYVAQAGFRGIDLQGVDIDVEGDLDLHGFFGLSDSVPAGYTEVRAKVSLNAPGASPEQIQELHDAVVKTSPVGNIISAPVKLKTELV